MTGPKEKRSSINNFLKYSGLGFQMLATIGLFTFVGYKLDEHQQNETPVLTAILGLIGVVISLYQVVRQLNKNQSK